MMVVMFDFGCGDFSVIVGSYLMLSCGFHFDGEYIIE